MVPCTHGDVVREKGDAVKLLAIPAAFGAYVAVVTLHRRGAQRTVADAETAIREFLTFDGDPAGVVA